MSATTIKKQYDRWEALRKATETCAFAQGAALVAEMDAIASVIAVIPGNGLGDVRCKLLMALEGADGMILSALADLDPISLQAAE
jgi:hypothetical protein